MGGVWRGTPPTTTGPPRAQEFVRRHAILVHVETNSSRRKEPGPRPGKIVGRLRARTLPATKRFWRFCQKLSSSRSNGDSAIVKKSAPGSNPSACGDHAAHDAPTTLPSYGVHLPAHDRDPCANMIMVVAGNVASGKGALYDPWRPPCA